MNTDYHTPQADKELETMRQQLETLKRKLSQQDIVNDRIIRKSMKHTANTIRRRYYAIMALSLFVIPYSYWVFVQMLNISTAFWIGTCVLMLICCGATFYNSLNVSNTNMATGNLVEVSRRMARAKKFDSDWLLFGIPAILVWFGWLSYEIYKIDNDLLNNPIFWGGCIGGIIGTIIGFYIHFRTQHQYEDIIDQIEEITAKQ